MVWFGPLSLRNPNLWSRAGLVRANHEGNDSLKSCTERETQGERESSLKASCTIKIINRYSAVVDENPCCLL